MGNVGKTATPSSGRYYRLCVAQLLLFMFTQDTCMYYRPPEKRATMNGDYASKSTFASRILPARHRELCAEFCSILIDLRLRRRTPALLRRGYTRRCEYAAPTQQVAVHDELRERAATYRQRLSLLLGKEVSDFNALLRQKDVPNILTTAGNN